jgi:hypothetical protein
VGDDAALAVTGAYEMATALALRPAAMPGRLILAAGGGLVAANPEHVGGSPTHGLLELPLLAACFSH